MSTSTLELWICQVPCPFIVSLHILKHFDLGRNRICRDCICPGDEIKGVLLHFDELCALLARGDLVIW